MAEEEVDRKQRMVESLRQNITEQKQQFKDQQAKAGAQKAAHEFIEVREKIEALSTKNVELESELKKKQRERDLLA